MKFIGEVTVTWLCDKPKFRKMITREEFSFIDSNNKLWSVPSQTIIDGASIPRLFWRLIGSPYTGAYRRPSVLHDYYCVIKNESYKKVHKMFYDACICEGYNNNLAWMLYQCLLKFGAKW